MQVDGLLCRYMSHRVVQLAGFFSHKWETVQLGLQHQSVAQNEMYALWKSGFGLKLCKMDH